MDAIVFWDQPVFWVAAVGFVTGLFLERCVRRLAFEKSVIWPIGRFCEHCYQPLGWQASIPILSYLWLRNRCPVCGVKISIRGGVLALLTAALFAGLYLLHVQSEGRFLPPNASPWYFASKHLHALFIYHCLLICFLILATFIDLDTMYIPDSVTIPGMVVGVALGTFWYIELHPIALWQGPPGPNELFAPHVWRGWFGDVPIWLDTIREFCNAGDHWQMNWNRYLGFATSIVGLLAGAGIVWVVRFVCSWAFGREAMGLGDVTLMAMVGAYLGWQTVILAFFLAPLSAVVVGILAWIITGEDVIPYGPHLSIASILCVFVWGPMWWLASPVFYRLSFFLVTAGTMLVLLVLLSLLLQWLKKFARRLWMTDGRESHWTAEDQPG